MLFRSVFETSKTQKILDENQRFDSYRKEIKRIYDSYYPIIAIEKMVNAVRLPAEIDLVDGLDEESAQTLNRWTSGTSLICKSCSFLPWLSHRFVRSEDFLLKSPKIVAFS